MIKFTPKELAKYLPGDVNLDNWKKMLQMLEAIATHINISRSEAQEVEKLLDVQKKINNTSQVQHSHYLLHIPS